MSGCKNNIDLINGGLDLERDSVNESGHAIPAVPCGDQCAVLFDAEPTELEDLDGY